MSRSLSLGYECGKCHETFGTLGLFDRHQDCKYWREGALKWLASVSCIRPEALGMVRDAKGWWQTPQGLISRSQRATRLAALRHRKKAA